MLRKVLSLFLCWVIFFNLVACEASETQGTFTATTMMEEVVATQNVATPTLAPTSTPTPMPLVIYVDGNAPGPTFDGRSWATAFSELQSGLEKAMPGDEIWVVAGIYYPDEGRGQNDNDRMSTFTLKEAVAIFGGFTGRETAREERDWASNLTVLSGDIDRNDQTDDHGILTDTANIRGSNAYHVLSGGGVSELAVLDGFIITGGNADGERENGQGGGMVNETSSPTLANLTFSGNWAYGGGAIMNKNSSPMLTNVTFSMNKAEYSGGGMGNLESSPILIDVTFSENDAISGSGGGIWNRNSNPVLTNVTFSQNNSSFDGGGMKNWDSNPTLTNVSFSNNRSEAQGGGMSNEGSSPKLTNVTFSRNSTAGGGGGMINMDSNPELMDVIFIKNSANTGGGIWSQASHMTLTNVTFTENNALAVGGMYNYKSNPILTNVSFCRNRAEWHGGGMTNSYSSPTLRNVIFLGNRAKVGGGMNNENSSPILTNVTFSGNIAESGSGMYNKNSTPTLSNTILWGNNIILWGNTAPSDHEAQIENGENSQPLITYSDIQGCGGSGVEWNSALGIDGGGNMDEDPLFIDADGNDLRLHSNSPCVDAGDNIALPPDITTDLDNKPRIVGSKVDMGAYEEQR